jgi:hypothetical protein
MQTYHGYIETGRIVTVDMPRISDGHKVIITVAEFCPHDDKANSLSLSRDEIDSMLEGSVTNSLIGSLPNPDISLEEIKKERLGKYEGADPHE